MKPWLAPLAAGCLAESGSGLPQSKGHAAPIKGEAMEKIEEISRLVVQYPWGRPFLSST